VTEAKKHPGSLVAKASATIPVFSYTAPKECGEGAISIFLHGASPTWTYQEQVGPRSPYGGTPDALVACNAGLSSYPEWRPVIQAAHSYEIPFASTEYAEQSAEDQQKSFPMMIGPTVMTRKEYPVAVNPFQRPGQRPIPMYRLPNTVNGFTVVVVKTEKKVKDSAQEGPSSNSEAYNAEDFDLD
jgi:hypothetical protein